MQRQEGRNEENANYRGAKEGEMVLEVKEVGAKTSVLTRRGPSSRVENFEEKLRFQKHDLEDANAELKKP